VTSTREIKRWEGLARSPIFAMISESISGVSTIRSNDASQYMKRKFEEYHDTHCRAFFGFVASSRWVGFRMDSLMFLTVGTSSLLAALFSERGKSIFLEKFRNGASPFIYSSKVHVTFQQVGLTWIR